MVIEMVLVGFYMARAQRRTVEAPGQLSEAWGCRSGCVGCYWHGLVHGGCRLDRDFSEKRVTT